jgi:hypothetical protein
MEDHRSHLLGEAPVGPGRVDRGQVGPGSGMARQGRHRRGRAGLGGAVRGAAGAGEAVRGALGDGDDACGSNTRERSERKKGRGWVLYPLMFIGPTHQPTNISRLTYVTAVVPYVRQPPDEHKLYTSV